MVVTKVNVENKVYTVCNLHDGLIEKTGGESGIRDYCGLYNSIYRILCYEQRYPENPFKVAAFILLELCIRHHFFDGNKRIAYLTMKIELVLSEYHFVIDYSNAVGFIMNCANSRVSIIKIEKWIKNNVLPITNKKIEDYLKEFGL